MENRNCAGKLRPYSFASLGFPSFAKEAPSATIDPFSTKKEKIVWWVDGLRLERKSTHSALIRVCVLWIAGSLLQELISHSFLLPKRSFVL